MTIDQLFRANEVLRKHANQREFPAQVVACFLFIATKGDCKQSEVAPALGLSESSASRNISWLGPENKLKRRSGLNWVVRYEDPEDYKANRVKLTPLGRQIVQEITNA